MPHIKLTETFFIDPETIAQIEQCPRSGEQRVDVTFKSKQLIRMIFWDDAAKEVWTNWKAYIDSAKQ